MDLPNIYEGNYSRLIVLPLLLVLISIILLPRVPFGIDLKGGVLVTLQLTQDVDEKTIAEGLNSIGITDVSIKMYKNPLGSLAEIEIPTDSRFEVIDDSISKLDSIETELGETELTLARLRVQQANGTDVAAQISSNEGKIKARLDDASALLAKIVLTASDISGKPEEIVAKDMASIKKAANTLLLDAKNANREKIIATLSNKASFSSYSLEEVSPTLSRLFISKIIGIATVSIVIATVVIFLIFRVPAPSIAVLVGAASDILMALGAMAIFQIPLTLTTFATLMMLVGLSLDTDMMLTIKTIKRSEDTPRHRAYGAFKTGVAMTSTVIIAFAVLMALGMIVRIPTYYQIGAVAVSGLIGDLIATWMLNAVLVLWHLEGVYGKFLGMVKR